ncbi:acetyl-CoA C-acetyltransferase [Gluconobacter japonicus]|uniref:Uncharacterized protein n=1 Tax=Gluconobacter japonicus TaxID=376620 RepID=A0ABQ5WJK9_GLUJA|nr:hypothetical protein [Gluconobacter japonicus]GBR26663.1 hypothetical protein AA3271_2349 [Gluconobacter japonicus NBRC 3271]GLQ59620.1 hypothetical protein GCM10010937_14230 [Gluconobacter japonicus]
MSRQRFTYQELAHQWGITVPAAKQRVRRAGWKRGKGNDGIVRVLVPEDTERMETAVPPKKPAESQALETLRDTVENLTSVTVRQAQRIDDLTTALLDSQEQNAALRERLATLEAHKATETTEAALPDNPPATERRLQRGYGVTLKRIRSFLPFG